MFTKVRKAVVAGIGAAFGIAQLVQAALADETISLDEARGILLAVTAAITAVVVYFVPNDTPTT